MGNLKSQFSHNLAEFVNCELFCFRGELSDDEDSVKEMNGLGKY